MTVTYVAKGLSPEHHNKCYARFVQSGPGRQVFILEITGSNPVPSTELVNAQPYGIWQIGQVATETTVEGIPNQTGNHGQGVT